MPNPGGPLLLLPTSAYRNVSGPHLPGATRRTYGEPAEPVRCPCRGYRLEEANDGQLPDRFPIGLGRPLDPDWFDRTYR